MLLNSEKWEKISPEEQAEVREEMCEHGEKMPPEERKKMRARMKERRENMPADRHNNRPDAKPAD